MGCSTSTACYAKRLQTYCVSRHFFLASLSACRFEFVLSLRRSCLYTQRRPRSRRALLDAVAARCNATRTAGFQGSQKTGAPSAGLSRLKGEQNGRLVSVAAERGTKRETGVCGANSEFPRINDFSGHKIFMKIVH